MEQKLPNISPESLEDEYNKDSYTNEDSKTGFDEKNYLNVRLGKNEKEKELRIRLLPMDLQTGNPFVHICTHNIEVPPEMVEPGKKPYKSYMCLDGRKNPLIDHNTYGSKCPICEKNHEEYEKFQNETDPIKKEEYKKSSLSYRAKDSVIIRCIERGKEEEGVKFWKFNLKFDNTDPYHQILDLKKQRENESLEATGVKKNILDIYNGRDLIIKITKGNTENQTAVKVTDYGFDMPLSQDENQMRQWIFDTKKWQDVFTTKPYDYLKLVLDGKIPWYDREQKCWVEKQDVSREKKEKNEEADKEIKEAESKYTSEKPVQPSQQPVQAQKPVEPAPVVSGPDDEEDLPF